MTLLTPGSTLWLLGHDLRLAGRDMRAAGRGRSATVATILLTTILLLHAVGFLTAPLLARLHNARQTDLLLVLSICVGGAFTLFLSKAISESIDALYQRGDLDLLLSSPMPMRRVLVTRLFAIAVIAGFLPILLVVPLLNGMVLRGYFVWAGTYPVLAALALTAAATGATLTFGLLSVLGPRWTRLAARALATFFGATSFLATQARLLLPTGLRDTLWQALQPTHAAAWPQWWPARALLGEAAPMAALLAVGIGAVLLVSRGLGHVYATGVLNTLSLPRTRAASGVAGRFRGGLLAALTRKEALLLVRHPGLSAQVFYQFLFLIPGAVALTRMGGVTSQTPAGVVFLTALMTGRIAKILVAPPFEADQAQALTTTAPVAPRTLLHAKLIVSIAALAVVGGLPLLVIGLRLPRLLPAACLACAGAAGTRLLLAMRRPVTLRRPGLQGRMPASADGLLGVMIDIAWGIGGAMLCAFA
jgi:ABC-2 type transport system permease protein